MWIITKMSKGRMSCPHRNTHRQVERQKQLKREKITRKTLFAMAETVNVPPPQKTTSGHPTGFIRELKVEVPKEEVTRISQSHHLKSNK